jgi:hypothetical protein
LKNPQFKEDISPSEISSLKTRRRKGDGSGCIYWRTVTKKGKNYQEAYYQYEFWKKGDRLVKSSKYIPKRMSYALKEERDRDRTEDIQAAIAAGIKFMWAMDWRNNTKTF